MSSITKFKSHVFEKYLIHLALAMCKGNNSFVEPEKGTYITNLFIASKKL
jgi:hypothetical protein